MSVSLVPVKEIKMMSPFHTLSVSHVDVDARQNSGDWHNIEGKCVLSKVALMRIASAAGIMWDGKASGIVSKTDTSVVFKAVAGIRMPDGTVQTMIGTKEIDLLVIEEEILEKHLSKGTKNPEAATRKELIQWRKNKVPRAETGAMLRCIRAVLGMKSGYTAQELQGGFDVPCISFTPDFQNPAAMQMISNGAYGFGSQAALSAPATLPALPAPHDDEDDTIDASYSETPEVTQEVTPEVKAPAQPQAQAQAQAQKPPVQEVQTQIPAVQTLAQTSASNGKRCKKCNASLSEGVARYSIEHHGEELCFDCQKQVAA